MPFTFAHPAIVLPLLHKRYKLFSSSGLIIGSIIPDFESFIRLSEHKQYSHTWLGMFWFDLPLAIIVAFIFHNLVRDPLINNLPDFLERKFKRFVGYTWNPYFRKHFLMIIVSMFIGIALHLFWDAFTHLNLSNPDAVNSTVTVGGFRLFKILQDTNSVLGIIFVGAYVLLLPAPTEQIEEPMKKMMYRIDAIPVKYGKLKYWAILCVTAAMFVFLAMNLITRHMTIVLFIDINIAAVLLGLVVAGVMTKAFQPNE